MQRTLAAVLTGWLVTAGVPAWAQPADGLASVVVPPGAEEVWALDAKRRAAVLAGDLDTLEELCADGLTYAHTDGTVDTKTSYLEMLRTGVRYTTMDLHDVSIARYDGTVVIAGVVQIAVDSPRGPIGFRARFTDVWAKQDGRWRFAAWQTSRIPE